MNTHHDISAIAAAPSDETVALREAVAVFPTEQAFLDAVDDLLEHGFDRSDLSVLAHGRNGGGIFRLLGDSVALADDGAAPRGAVAAPASIAQAEAASVALPAFAGTVGGLLLAAATGGTLALVLPLAIGGGVAGSGLGLLGAVAIAGHHRNAIEEQIANGGILLWVRTGTAEREDKALKLLAAAGGEHVHPHAVTIRWGVDAVPLARFNPDPLLEKGPDYD